MAQSIPDVMDLGALLEYGLIGLALVLAFLAFLLLRAQGQRPTPSRQMIAAIRNFMILSILLALGAGAIQFGPWAMSSTTKNSFVEERDPTARASFLLPEGAAHTLRGTWRSQWWVCTKDFCDNKLDSQGNPTDANLIANRSDPADKPTFYTNSSELFASVMDPDGKIDYRYWWYGRVSSKNYVTLLYWSESQDDNPINDALVGVAFLKVIEKVGAPLRMEGYWRGYVRETREDDIDEGERTGFTVWTSSRPRAQ